MATRNFSQGDRVAVLTGARHEPVRVGDHYEGDNQFHPEDGYYHGVLVGFEQGMAHVMSEMGEEHLVDAARLAEPIE